MILAAVSISAVYNSKIINYATNGAVDYATESVKENEILDKTTSLMESAISNIESINAGNGGTSGSKEEPDEGGDDENPPPVEEPEVGIDFGDMTEEDITNNYVGKYVDYTPVSGTFSDHVGSTYSGDTQNLNTQLSTDTSLKWKILFADNNKLTLIADKSVHNGFTLEGAEGYNNGVLLLNNGCKAMYSNSSLGATGRSLKIEDIESVSEYKGATNTEYSISWSSYPNIFAQEESCAITGEYGKLGRSEQNDYVNGYSQTISNTGRQTVYSYKISTTYMLQIYLELLKTNIGNWIASRCVDFGGNDATFHMFYIEDITIDVVWLYDSGNSSYDDNSYAIRPIVEIDLTKVNVGITGTGTENDGYSLTLK